MQIRRFTAAIVLVAASACVKSYVPPEDRVFAPGRYMYAASVHLSDDSDVQQLRGFLVLTAVTPDSLAGYWRAGTYHPTLYENRWNVASYEVHARAVAGGDTVTVIHHIKRGRHRDRPSCRLSLIRPGYAAEGTCELRRMR